MVKLGLQNNFYFLNYEISIYQYKYNGLYINIIHEIIVINKNTIILKNSHYFCRYRYKNRLRTFQPQNGQKFKNKPGWPKIVVLIKKSVR